KCNRLVRQRSRGARRHTFTAGDAGALAHRLIEVEGDAGAVALAGTADDLVGLNIVAGTDAAIAENARLVIYSDDRGRQVPGTPRRGGSKAHALRPKQPIAPAECLQLAIPGGPHTFAR